MKAITASLNTAGLRNIRWKFIFSWLVVILVLLIFTTRNYYRGWEGSDWRANYRPASLGLFNKTTYNAMVYNPPWIFLLLYPFALLPPALGQALIGTIGVIVLAYTGFRLEVKPWIMGLLITTPFVQLDLRNGSIDWLISLGFILPPQLGLFLILAKPQVGIGLVAVWFLQAWQKGKIGEVIRIFSPVTISLLISVLVYGPPAIGLRSDFSRFIRGSNMDQAALWPYALPFGLCLLVYALCTKKKNIAVLSSPLFAPYIALYSLPFSFLPLASEPLVMLAAVIGFWVVSLLTGYANWSIY